MITDFNQSIHKEKRGREHKSHPHVSRPQPLGGGKNQIEDKTQQDLRNRWGRRRFSPAGLFRNSTIKHPSAVCGNTWHSRMEMRFEWSSRKDLAWVGSNSQRKLKKEKKEVEMGARTPMMKLIVTSRFIRKELTRGYRASGGMEFLRGLGEGASGAPPHLHCLATPTFFVSTGHWVKWAKEIHTNSPPAVWWKKSTQDNSICPGRREKAEGEGNRASLTWSRMQSLQVNGCGKGAMGENTHHPCAFGLWPHRQ